MIDRCRALSAGGAATVFSIVDRRQVQYVDDPVVGRDHEQHTARIQETHRACDAGGKVVDEIGGELHEAEIKDAVGGQVFPLVLSRCKSDLIRFYRQCDCRARVRALVLSKRV